MLPIPAILIAVATAFEAGQSGFWRESISDYYQGPVRDVFVGGLMAAGICMIIYKGESKLEDYALNFAGLNAFFVALVPNNFTDVLREAPTQAFDSATRALTRQELLSNLHLVLLAFLVTAVIYVIVDSRMSHWTRYTLKGQRPISIVMVCLAWALEIVFLVAVVLRLAVLERETVAGFSIFQATHFGAAVLLIVNLSFAVASNAWPDRLRARSEGWHTSRAIQSTYVVIALLMWLGLVVGFVMIVGDVPWAIIITEYYAIAMFISFWVVSIYAAERRARTNTGPTTAVAGDRVERSDEFREATPQ